MENKELTKEKQKEIAVPVSVENQAVDESEIEIDFTVLDTSFTYGEPRQI